MASIKPSVIRSLDRLRCSIFQTSYNPSSKRSGAKYLRDRLRGPSMVDYYPPDPINITKLNKMYPGFNLVDRNEVQRLIDIRDRKERGKGAPKKAKNKGRPQLVYSRICRLKCILLSQRTVADCKRSVDALLAQSLLVVLFICGSLSQIDRGSSRIWSTGLHNLPFFTISLHKSPFKSCTMNDGVTLLYRMFHSYVLLRTLRCMFPWLYLILHITPLEQYCIINTNTSV